jgi:hypothetical protein
VGHRYTTWLVSPISPIFFFASCFRVQNRFFFFASCFRVQNRYHRSSIHTNTSTMSDYSASEEDLPARGAAGPNKWKPSDVLNDKDSDDSEKIETIRINLQAEASKLYCTQVTKSGKRNLKCSCLRPLEDNDVAAAVACGVLDFCKKGRVERQGFIMMSIRYSKNTKKFLLPFANPGGLDGGSAVLETMENLDVCQSSLMTVLGVGTRMWKTCKKAVVTGILPAHGLTKKPSNRQVPFAVAVAGDLHTFLEDIKQYAEPRATRTVREQTGFELREEEKGL